MASISDTEDLELESLRSAVLASLKPKPVEADKAEEPKPSSQDDEEKEEKKDEEDDDDDEEALLALRLAALKSKKETGPSASGSPLHQPQPPVPPPILQRGTGASGNLITIQIQEPLPPPPPPPQPQARSIPDEGKEEEKTKFSRFESDSESEDDFLLDSDSYSSGKSGDYSDSDGSRNSESDSEADSGSRSDVPSGKGLSQRLSGEEQDDDGGKKGDAKLESESHSKDNIESKESVIGDDGKVTSNDSEKGQIREKLDKKKDGENSESHKKEDLRTKIRSENRDRRRRDRALERRRDRDEDGRRGERDDRRRDRQKLREERRRLIQERRERRLSLKQDRFRDRHLDSTIDEATLEARRRKFAGGNNLNIKDRMVVTLKSGRTLENGERSRVGSRERTFQFGGELMHVTRNTTRADESDSDISLPSDKEEVKSKTLKRKEEEEKKLHKKEINEETVVNKVNEGKEKEKEKGIEEEETKLPKKEMREKTVLNKIEEEGKKEKGIEEEEEKVKDVEKSENSSSSSASSSSSSSSSSEDEDEKKDANHSESESDNENSRFKHKSRNDSKQVSAAPTQSRLISSMALPKDGVVATSAPPRRRPLDTTDRNKDRSALDDRGAERRRHDDHDRRAILPRAYRLDLQERTSRRDGSRLEITVSRRARDRNEDRHGRERNGPDRQRLDRDDEMPKLASRISSAVEKPRPARRKATSARDFVSESSASETEAVSQPLRSIVKTDKRDSSKKVKSEMKSEIGGLKRKRNPKVEGESTEKRLLGRKERTDGDDDKYLKKKTKKEKKSKEKKVKVKKGVKERIGTKVQQPRDTEIASDGDLAAREVHEFSIAEDDAVRKKVSVLDRLGSAPSSDKARSSIKSRLGPVKKSDELSDMEEEPVDQLGPDGDSVKRRNIEVNDTHSNRQKKRLKVKRRHSSEEQTEKLDDDVASELYNVVEPLPKRKQLSQSLLSRLSERPSTQKNDLLESRSRESSPDDAEVKRRRVTSRDVDDKHELERKTERKSKNRLVWSSRRRDDDDDDIDGEDFGLSEKVDKLSRTIVASKIRAKISELDKELDEMKARKKERKSKTKDIWSSRRKVSKERTDFDRDLEDGDQHKGKADKEAPRDVELEERIKKIKAKNAAIIERQKLIEEEKKMFGGR